MFSWDARKARGNLKKHAVSFEEAATVFDDADALEFEDYDDSHQEFRRTRIGFSALGRLLFVVYTIRRLKHGQETFRIISARQTTRKEREIYSR